MLIPEPFLLGSDSSGQTADTMGRVLTILGTPVAVTTCDEVARQALAWERAGDRAYAVAAADVHVITRARRDPAFGAAVRRFDLVCPDGMPLVWALNGRLEPEHRLRERVSGTELMAAVLRGSVGGGSHFLLGGDATLHETLVEKLAEGFPGAVIAGTYGPPFGEWPADEFERISARIRDSGARFVWVGLGCPKQERWIGDHLDRLPAGVYFAVGAAFAFHAGLVERAPAWCRDHGLEWAYRIYREPRRLFRRYFTYNSLFLWYRLRERLGGS